MTLPGTIDPVPVHDHTTTRAMTTDQIDHSSHDVKESASSTPLTREALYALVWSEPMLKVSARYGVSSSYMARVCTLLNVPRPERGYWAKLAVGRAPTVPPLPDARPGDELAWSRDGQHHQVAKLKPRPPSSTTRKQPKSGVPRETHPLTVGAKAHFQTGRLSYEGGYLKPSKRKLVDLVVSETGLDKALSFATKLFLSLEDKGYRVVLAPSGEQLHRAEVDEHEVPRKNRNYNNLWSPWSCTVVYVGTVAIGLTIIEMSEEAEVRYVDGTYIRERDYVPPRRGRYTYDHSWTTKKDFATGRLCLQAYSPYPRARWVNHWRETKDHDLGSQVKGIVKELERAAVIIARLAEEGERQAELEHRRWEAQQEEWRREEAKRKAEKALKDSREDLFRIISGWAESNRIEQFFLDAEGRAATLNDSERLKIMERLKRARLLIGGTDALEHFMTWRSPDER